MGAKFLKRTYAGIHILHPGNISVQKRHQIVKRGKMMKSSHFQCFSIKIYAVGIYDNCIAEVILIDIHTI